MNHNEFFVFPTNYKDFKFSLYLLIIPSIWRKYLLYKDLSSERVQILNITKFHSETKYIF